MVGIILLQKSSAEGFTGGSSSNSGSFMTGRAAGNFLTRVTTFLAAAFLINSLVLAYLSAHSDKSGSLIGGSEPVAAAPKDSAVPKDAGGKDKAAPASGEVKEKPAAKPEEKIEEKSVPAATAPVVPAGDAPVSQKPAPASRPANDNAPAAAVKSPAKTSAKGKTQDKAVKSEKPASAKPDAPDAPATPPVPSGE